ncbi:MAG: inositol monophosphatase family protein [Bacteroidales bacterium]
MPYQRLCEQTREAVHRAAEYVREQHRNRDNLQVESKGTHDYVTRVDRQTEEILVRELSRILPEAGFVTEEGTSVKKGEDFHWVIDPIDGTTNFIHGTYPFAISVALARGTEVVVGVVHEFGFEETFTAWKGGGAWCNGKPIRVSSAPAVKDALIATGFPYTNFSRLTEFKASMDHFMAHSHGLRRLGSAATDIAYVACGRYDAFYEYGLHAWDIAAGILLVREAGGRITDFAGNPDVLFSDTVACANGLCFREFQETIEKIMIRNEPV